MTERPEPSSGRLFDLEMKGRPSERDLAALREDRSDPMTLEEYCRFLSEFHFTREELLSAPFHDGERFRL